MQRKNCYLQVPQGWIYSIAITGDSKYIVAGSSDKILRKWSLEDKILSHFCMPSSEAIGF